MPSHISRAHFFQLMPSSWSLNKLQSNPRVSVSELQSAQTHFQLQSCSFMIKHLYMLNECFSANGTWMSDYFNRSSVKLSTERRRSSCAINGFTPADGGKRGSETPFVDVEFLFSHFTFCTSYRLKRLKALRWFLPQWRKWPVALTRLTGNKNKDFWQGDEMSCLQLSL